MDLKLSNDEIWENQPLMRWIGSITLDASSTEAKIPEIIAQVQDWTDKQHYKSGRGTPPWIKLHRKILDSRRFQSLPLASKALAPQLWLLAAEGQGSINIDPEELVFRLRWPREDIENGLKPLIDNNYLIIAEKDAIKMLSRCYQDATPETETETETETDKDTRACARARESPKQKNQISEIRDILKTVLKAETADDVIEHRRRLRKPLTARAAKGLIKQYQRCRDGPEAAAEAQITNGWTGFNPEWMQNEQRNSGNRKRSTSGVVETVRRLQAEAEDGGLGGRKSDPCRQLIER